MVFKVKALKKKILTQKLLHFRTFRKQILISILCPTVPAVLHAIQFRVSNAMKKCVRMLKDRGNEAITLKAEAKLVPLRLKQASINTLRVSLKMTENVLENYVQLFLVLLITLTMNSETSSMQLSGIDEILKGGDSNTFLYISATISFVSLVKGHIDMVTAKRNGMVGMVGKLILLPYVLISIASR